MNNFIIIVIELIDSEEELNSSNRSLNKSLNKQNNSQSEQNGDGPKIPVNKTTESSEYAFKLWNIKKGDVLSIENFLKLQEPMLSESLDSDRLNIESSRSFSLSCKYVRLGGYINNYGPEKLNVKFCSTEGIVLSIKGMEWINKNLIKKN